MLFNLFSFTALQFISIVTWLDAGKKYTYLLLDQAG